MAYDEHLAERIEHLFNQKHIQFDEKKMMGGLCFMVQEKMCLGIVSDKLMARVGRNAYEECLKQEGATVMDFTKRPMRSFVFVHPEGVDRDEDLAWWVDQCLAYNPFAKSSKK